MVASTWKIGSKSKRCLRLKICKFCVAPRHLQLGYVIPSCLAKFQVNLPARLVIIRNTVCWDKALTREYNEMDIFQMIGRAGRKQYDDLGIGSRVAIDYAYH